MAARGVGLAPKEIDSFCDLLSLFGQSDSFNRLDFRALDGLLGQALSPSEVNLWYVESDDLPQMVWKEVELNPLLMVYKNFGGNEDPHFPHPDEISRYLEFCNQNSWPGTQKTMSNLAFATVHRMILRMMAFGVPKVPDSSWVRLWNAMVRRAEPCWYHEPFFGFKPEKFVKRAWLAEDVPWNLFKDLPCLFHAVSMSVGAPVGFPSPYVWTSESFPSIAYTFLTCRIEARVCDSRTCNDCTSFYKSALTSFSESLSQCCSKDVASIVFQYLIYV